MENNESMLISVVIALVTVAVTLLVTVVTVFSLYRKALKDTKSRIEEIEKETKNYLSSLEKEQNVIKEKLSFEDTQCNFIILTSRSTQSWNEKKICTHLKIEFEIVDLIVRHFDEFEDSSGIIGYKRYSIAKLLRNLINQKFAINEDPVTIIDCRRTIIRIMEGLRGDPILAGKLADLHYLADYTMLQAAAENIMYQAENRDFNFHIDNVAEIERMAK